MRHLILVLLVIATAALAGCGQTGPLFLPPDPDETAVEQDAEGTTDPEAGPGGATAEEFSESAEDDEEQDDAPEP